MNTPTMSLKNKKSKIHKKKKSFPWLGMILVLLGLASIFYFIDSPDIKKISKPQSSSSFLGSADDTFKN